MEQQHLNAESGSERKMSQTAVGATLLGKFKM